MKSVDRLIDVEGIVHNLMWDRISGDANESAWNNVSGGVLEQVTLRTRFFIQNQVNE